MKNKLTIILPLLDREEHTKIWIDSNITSEFEYIIADGSSNNKNQLLFMKKELPNVQYIRYPHDKTIKDFLYKMADSSLKSKTEYTMTVDNDDFLNFDGIKKCIQTLEKNKEYDIASGNIHFVRSVNNSKPNVCKYKLLKQKSAFTGYANTNGFDQIKKYLNLYSKNISYPMYAVYKTSLFQKVFNTLIKSKLYDLEFFEHLHSQLSFSLGNFVPVNTNHLIRLTNPIFRFTDIKIDRSSSWRNRILFSDKARNDVLNMYKFISGFNIGREKELKNIYINYFTVAKKPKVHKKTSLKLIINFIKDVCFWFFSKFYNFNFNMIPSLKIENIRVIIYKYYLIRSYVNNDN